MGDLRAFGTVDLRDNGGVELRSVLAQPKRVAILIYLTLAQPRGFQRRDKLLSLFWPDLDEQHARDALNQALHFLRRALPEQAITSRGTDEVALDLTRLSCDCVRFEELLAAGRLEDALELYRGDLLESFHAKASVEFDSWMDRERARFRGLACGAAARLRDDTEAAGQLQLALSWARRALIIDPLDESNLRRLVQLLDRGGDRSTAVRAYDEFARRLGRELELEPAPETRVVIETVRQRAKALLTGAAPDESMQLDSVAASVRPKGVGEFTRQTIIEIHRRSIWQVLGVYLAGSWVGYQVIKELTQVARLPDWVPVFAIVLIVLGLPLVLATAFVQQGAPGLRASGPASNALMASSTPRFVAARLLTWRNALAGGLLAVAAWGMVAAVGYVLRPGPAIVAVLPCRSSSTDPEHAEFAAGFHDELINLLSQVGLRPIARTSVIGYANTTTKAADITRELGASSLVECSVQRDRARVRISVQLIDPRTSTTIWGDRYDRDLANIFDIQTNVASQVAGALDIALSKRQLARLRKSPTRNLEAYDYYRRGIQMTWLGPGNAKNAIILLEKAVQIDSEFAAAHAALSDALSLSYWRSPNLAGKPTLESSRTAAEQSLRLDPDLAAGHAALGMYYYRSANDYEKAFEHVARAAKREPGNYFVLEALHSIQRRRGHWEEAFQAGQEAIRLNPLYAYMIEQVGVTAMHMRRYEEARELLDRAIAVRPLQGTFMKKVKLLMLSEANPDSIKAVIEEAGSRLGREAELFVLRTGETRSALRLLLASGHYRDGLALHEPAANAANRYRCIAEYHREMGSPDMAKLFEDSARVILEQGRRGPRPESSRLDGWSVGLAHLATTYAALGLRDKALAAARQANDSLPILRDTFNSVDGPNGPAIALAEVYVRLGELDKAIDQLSVVLAVPGTISVTLLRADPLYQPLQSHPRFQKLLAQYSAQKPR